jgi:hypothetical protein
VLATGLAAVLVSALALAGMRGSDESVVEQAREARHRALTAQELSCPASVGSRSDLVVASVTDEGGGTITGRKAGGSGDRPVEVPAGAVEEVTASSKAVVLSARGGSAVGLAGARLTSSPAPASAECVAPQPEVWFNGAGAGGLHESTMLLVNPDRGPAVADITLWTTTGMMDVPVVRGVTVPGGASVEIDLAEVAPTREELTVRVVVNRGRIATTISDTYTPRGGSRRTDSIPASTEPGTDVVLPGIPRNAAEGLLVVANPGEDAARVTLTVVGAEAEFEPEAFGEIRVPAGQLSAQDLPDEVTTLLASEDVSLRLVSSEPVTAGVRVVSASDFAHFPAVAPADGDSVAIVPASGRRTVVLTATDRSAAVDLEFLGATTSSEENARVRVRPRISTAVEVPAGTRAVVVRSSVPTVGAVRTITSQGVSLAPLRALVTEKVIPDVRPAW